MAMPFIVMVGNLSVGWTPFGPFQTKTEADSWVESQGFHPDYAVFVMELELPDGYEDADQ